MKIPTTVLTITLTIALVTSIALIGSDATAKNKKANGMMRMFAGLELTQEQRQDIRQVMVQTRQDNSIYDADRWQSVQQYKMLMQMSTWDEAAAQQFIDDALEQREEVALNKAEAKNAIFNILTDEQVAKMEQRISKRAENRSDRKARKDMRLGRMKKALELTDAQVAELALIAESRSEAMSEFKGTGKEHKQAERELIQSENFDEQAWRDLYQSASENKASAQLIMMQSKYELLAVLSDEQKQKLMKMLKRMKKNRRG